MRHFVWVALLVSALGAAFAASKAKKEGPVTASLRVEPVRAHPGQKIALRLTVTNRSPQEVKLFFNSGRKYDFTVTRGEEEVWRWSHGRAFTMAITQITLKPGESRTFEDSWEQKDNDDKRVPEGAYTVTGIVTARPEIRAAPVDIRIIATGQARRRVPYEPNGG